MSAPGPISDPLLNAEKPSKEQTRTDYMRTHQIEEAESQIQTLRGALQNPHVQEKAAVAKRLRAAEGDYDRRMPPDLNPQERDRLVKRERELREHWSDPGIMPTAEEMRKRPPGAIDKHITWDRKCKASVLEWKQIQILLHKGDEARDIANIEMHRPRTNTLAMDNPFVGSTTMMSFPSPQYQHNYDQINWAEQAKDHENRVNEQQEEIAKLRAELAAKGIEDPTAAEDTGQPLTSPAVGSQSDSEPERTDEDLRTRKRSEARLRSQKADS